jgi:hypothetical protein
MNRQNEVTIKTVNYTPEQYQRERDGEGWINVLVYFIIMLAFLGLLMSSQIGV